MWGRYALHSNHPAVTNAFDIRNGAGNIAWGQFQPRYNIAPTQQVMTVVSQAGERRGEMMRWGLIPFWTRELKGGKTPVDARGKIVNTPINARAETIETTRSFSSSFKKRRCLIPADGFYEWKGPKGARTPLYIFSESRELFAMAGIWGAWKAPDGMEIQSCAIVTTLANSFMQPIHNRMPVMLTKGAEDIWLDEAHDDLSELKELLVPYPSHEMEAHEVSSMVNSVSNVNAQCIEPVHA